MTFSWSNHKKKAEIKLLYRVNKMSKDMDGDFRKDHPELAKEAGTGTTNVEAKKFVNKILAKKFKYAQMPKPSVIIKRMNRVV